MGEDIEYYLRRMLELKYDDEIPQDLYNRVNRVVNLITLALDDGEPHLRSKQVLAVIVEQWERDQLVLY